MAASQPAQALTLCVSTLQARLVLCLALAAACAAVAAASGLPCPAGLVGESCGTCTTGEALLPLGLHAAAA